MSDSRPVSGLPNLPLLAGAWQPFIIFPTCDPADWKLIVDNDPTRWLIDFTAISNRSIIVSQAPDVGHVNGWTIGPLANKTFKYKDWGNIVQLPWYVYDGGGGLPIMVTTQSIQELE